MNTAKKVLIGLLLTAVCFLTVSCKKNETGMHAAWEGLQALQENVSYKHNLFCDYQEAADTLTIGISSLMDLDVLFDTLDKSVKGADLGTLVFDIVNVMPGDAFTEKLSARLGSLPCKSIHCLVFSQRTMLKDEAWTAILDRTEILYQPPLKSMPDYSETGLANLAQVKKLWISGMDTDSLEGISVLTGLEEITLSAGLTDSEQEETRDALAQKQKTDSAATSVYESDIYTGIGFFKSAKDLANLKRVLFYPELDGWTPDSRTWLQIYSLQTYMPDIEINAPTTAWSGDESALVTAGSIQVSEHAGGIRLVDTAFDCCLREKASVCYDEGKSFTESFDKPVLKGTCLVYMAVPQSYDSNGKPLDEFFRNGFQILRDDAFKSPESPADAITTFVYVYPEYAYYGQYTDGTKAYQTTTLVQVYDMEQRIRYAAWIADETDPEETIYTDGSGRGSSRASMDPEAVLDFLKTLE